MARTEDFISNVRQAVTQLVKAEESLRALQAEATYMDYLTVLDDEADFVGANADITKAELFAALSTTGDAIKALFDAGHGTNVNRVRL
jgi:hypothetical protein